VRCASVSPSPQSPPTGGGEVILGNRMGKYLIIGCGYFGSRAAEKLLRKDPKPKIIVVDRNKEAVKKVSNLPVEKISYLQRGVERDERKKKGE
jgi:saccharopine dehydrogenase-like NADP-dependent oxidoreductase